MESPLMKKCFKKWRKMVLDHGIYALVVVDVGFKRIRTSMNEQSLIVQTFIWIIIFAGVYET